MSCWRAVSLSRSATDFKTRVPDRMSEGIVHHLEMIEVDKEEPGLLFVPRRFGQQIGEPFQQKDYDWANR